MYCKKCGKKIDDDSIYCASCGNKINTTKNKQKSSSMSNEEKTTEEDKLSVAPCLGGVITRYIIFTVLWTLLDSGMKTENTVLWIASFSLLIAIIIMSITYLFKGVNNLNKKGIISYFNGLLSSDPLNKTEESSNKEWQINLYISSFFNGCFGGIWGLLFNYNHNLNKVGFSHYVIGAISALALILIVILGWQNFWYCLQDCWVNLGTKWVGLLFVVIGFLIATFGSDYICTAENNYF